MTDLSATSSCQCYFEASHEQHSHPDMRALERDVLGCDFGGTSWTTRSQADLIPKALGLDAEAHLLEIGAGTGWPGLYMSSMTACEVTLLDIPVNALKQAWQRAIDDGIQDRSHCIAASGNALPFAAGSFNAIGHSDVLCCLPEKLAMLQECRRVATEGARMLFYVIAPARGLSESDLEKACEVGPPFVGVPDDYENLIAASAWDQVEKTDLTEDYLQALKRLVTGLRAKFDTLKTVMGEKEFNDQVAHRQDQVDAIEYGLLEREVYLVQAI